MGIAGSICASSIFATSLAMPGSRLGLDTEIGFPHRRMVANLVGRAFCNSAAEIEHDHVLAQGADEVHVVLHHQHGDAAFVAQRSEALAQQVGFSRIEAGGRLVEQQQARLSNQRAHQLDALLQSVGQASHGRALVPCKAGLGERGRRSLADEREATLEGLRSAHGFLQGRIASELHLKRTPTLEFSYDETTDRALRVEELIEEMGRP